MTNVQTQREIVLALDLELAYKQRIDFIFQAIYLEIAYFDRDPSIVDRYILNNQHIIDSLLVDTISIFIGAAIARKLPQHGERKQMLAAAITSVAQRIQNLRSYLPEAIATEPIFALNGLVSVINYI